MPNYNHQSMKERKASIRTFLREPAWTEEKLCGLLAHAESKLAFQSCCCLVGSITADHALRGRNADYTHLNSHYYSAQRIETAFAAERAYGCLVKDNTEENDAKRRRILRPIIRAELRRRERLRQPIAPAFPLEMAVV